jgi:uncharacterized protein YqjF (DUF2071 family)
MPVETAPRTSAFRTPTPQQRLAARERPVGRPVMWQEWRDLLFLHWRIDPDIVQARLPPGLTVDCYDGAAWLGVVPFFMRNIQIRPWPRIPTATNFLELNLRTYVHDAHGKPGVWFFSLDANSALTVWGARAWFHLPYYRAVMSAVVDPATRSIDYRCHRRGTEAGRATRYVYRPKRLPSVAEPETLEWFLIERYILFSEVRPGVLATGQVHHPPYTFAPAEVSAWSAEPIRLGGFDIGDSPPDHGVVSPGVGVDVFGLQWQ